MFQGEIVIEMWGYFTYQDDEIYKSLIYYNISVIPF